MNLDIVVPMAKRDRGQVIGMFSKVTLLEYPPEALTKEVVSVDGIVTVEELTQFVVDVSHQWRRKVAGEHQLDTESLSVGKSIPAKERNKLLSKMLMNGHFGCSVAMQSVSETLHNILIYPCVLLNDDQPLHILCQSVQNKQFMAFLLIAKEFFLRAEEQKTVTHSVLQGCIVVLQDIGSRICGPKLDLKLKWIHVIIIQELKKLGAGDFPTGFEKLANHISFLVAFFVPESVRGSSMEDPDIASQVVEFVEEQESLILGYMDTMYAAIHKAAHTGADSIDIPTMFLTFMKKKGIQTLADGSFDEAYLTRILEDEHVVCDLASTIKYGGEQDPGLLDRPRFQHTLPGVPAQKEFEMSKNVMSQADKKGIPGEGVHLQVSELDADAFRKALRAQIQRKTRLLKDQYEKEAVEA